MIIVLNGPLGIGKSTLGETLMERLDDCVYLDGDRLIAVNPPPVDALGQLHAVFALLIAHYRREGYRHFVLDYLWRSPAELEALRRTLSPLDDEVRCFLLTLPVEENLRRIQRRASVRAINEDDFERRTFVEERELLAACADGELGEPFDVSAPPEVLADVMSRRLGLEPTA